MYLIIIFTKWRPFCSGLNVLNVAQGAPDALYHPLLTWAASLCEKNGSIMTASGLQQTHRVRPDMYAFKLDIHHFKMHLLDNDKFSSGHISIYTGVMLTWKFNYLLESDILLFGI